MDYRKLLHSDRVTDVGLIGTGTFGRSFLVQSSLIPGIRVIGVCDQETTKAEEACRQSGFKPECLKVCHTESDAKDAIACNKTAIFSDARLLLDLPLGVVIEASGMPEAGAVHARAAIEKGRHVVMASKEADCVAGPILNRLAADAGVVYTPTDGDQPSLLIGLISWAETLGFEIVCAGKASELDFVFEHDSNTYSRGSQTVVVAGEDLWQLPGGALESGISLRRRMLKSLPQFSVADLCEMALVINATGYHYDTPRLHAPIVRITEMPELLCSRPDGGIFQKEGVIDIVNCLRRSDEVSFAGGVFVIVKCRGKDTWQLLKDKGHLVNHDGTRAMIFRPYHLLGIETATSVLAANLLELSCGGIDVRPRVDLGVRANRILQAGTRLDLDHDHSIAGVVPEILPAKKMNPDNPVPYYMAAGHKLKATVEDGQLLTYGMIDHDGGSCLWQLRREQDELFDRPGHH